MTADPTEPETFENNATSVVETVIETDVEAPEADAAEQHTDLAPHREEEVQPSGDPATANEADRVEQARIVELDEDDYR